MAKKNVESVDKIYDDDESGPRVTRDVSGYNPMEGIEEDDDTEDDGLEVDPEEVLSEIETEEEPEDVEEEEEQQPEQQQYDPSRDPNVAWARARLLEKERNALQARLSILVDTLQKAAEAKQEPEEEEEDYSTLPAEEQAAAISKKVLREIEEFKKESQKKREGDSINNAVVAADSQIAMFAQQNPLYGPAVAHLAAIELDEFLDLNPGLTPEEAEQRMLVKLQEDKLHWLSLGKNPGVEIWKKSIRRGFQPQAFLQQSAQQSKQEAESKTVQKQKQETDEVAAFKKQKDKKQSARTIASISGSQGHSSVNPKSFQKMSEAQFADTMTKLIGRAGNTPKFRDLLKGLERTDAPKSR